MKKRVKLGSSGNKSFLRVAKPSRKNLVYYILGIIVLIIIISSNISYKDVSDKFGGKLFSMAGGYLSISRETSSAPSQAEVGKSFEVKCDYGRGAMGCLSATVDDGTCQ